VHQEYAFSPLFFDHSLFLSSAAYDAERALQKGEATMATFLAPIFMAACPRKLVHFLE
jgi:hypothetical protein